MAGITDFLGNAIAARFLAEAGTGESPTIIAVALFTAAPSGDSDDAGTAGTEVTNANNYARVSTDPSSIWQQTDSTGQIDNQSTIAFGTASGSWGTVTDFGLFDSATYGAGNLLAYGSLTTSKAPGSGDTPQFAAGGLTGDFNSN